MNAKGIDDIEDSDSDDKETIERIARLVYGDDTAYCALSSNRMSGT